MFTKTEYTQEQNEILDLTGATNWLEIEKWFGSMTRIDILEEANVIWRNDDNEDFANRIFDALNYS